VGGSDQWGNITAGIDLVRRTTGEAMHGLTVPLVTRADGAKFGKTAEGAVWLDAERTSPYDLYQYFVHVEDADVERFLLQLTLLPVAEVTEVVAAHAAAPEQRAAQRRLAAEVTALVHGEAAASEAVAASEGFTRSAASLSAPELEALVDEIPTTRLAGSDLAGGAALVDLLVAAGLARSKGDARRLVGGGGIYLNDQRQEDDRPVGEGDLLHGRFLVLRRGKRARHLVVVG
jgi:tyrosyl-tRNA synthetase